MTTASKTKKSEHAQKKTILQKIVVNVGVGRLRNQAQFEDKILPEVIRELSMITGQHPAPRKAKKAIASFKTRVGDIVGLQVTLRGRRMHSFLVKVIHMALPRVKDFRGLPLTNVDAHGNMNIGFREQYVFPEINIEKSKVNFGVQVTLVPRSTHRNHALDFYRSLGIPFMK